MRCEIMIQKVVAVLHFVVCIYAWFCQIPFKTITLSKIYIKYLAKAINTNSESKGKIYWQAKFQVKLSEVSVQLP